ncbi:hypothetical protein Zm00014a_023055 [Zea mays]|nr:hypothetical protein Zm00014a_023055 [Zea mays]
MRAIIF